MKRRFDMSLFEIPRKPMIFDLGDVGQVRELVERCIARGWCRRPKQLSRDEEMEALRQRIAELEAA